MWTLPESFGMIAAIVFALKEINSVQWKPHGRPLVLREHAIRSCLENLNGVGGRFVRAFHTQLF